MEPEMLLRAPADDARTVMHFDNQFAVRLIGARRAGGGGAKRKSQKIQRTNRRAGYFLHLAG